MGWLARQVEHTYLHLYIIPSTGKTRYNQPLMMTTDHIIIIIVISGPHSIPIHSPLSFPPISHPRVMLLLLMGCWLVGWPELDLAGNGLIKQPSIEHIKNANPHLSSDSFHPHQQRHGQTDRHILRMLRCLSPSSALHQPTHRSEGRRREGGLSSNSRSQSLTRVRIKTQ